MHWLITLTRVFFGVTCMWLLVCIVSYHYDKVPRAVQYTIESQRTCAREGDLICMILWVLFTAIPPAIASYLFSKPTSTAPPQKSGYPAVPVDQLKGKLAVSGEEGEPTHKLPSVD